MRGVRQLGRNEHIGFLLEKDGVVLEYACWLRSANDAGHINLAKLNAVVNGVKLALQWQERSRTCAPRLFVSPTGCPTGSAVQCLFYRLGPYLGHSSKCGTMLVTATNVILQRA